MTSLKFNTVLLDISKALTADQLREMKFVLTDIGKGQKEKLDTGYKLFQLLMERNQLGVDNTAYLCGLLNNIDRQDLAAKLNDYESQHTAEFTENQPNETERAKLDIATEVIVENIGSTWRRLGRKLRLTEPKLDSISEKHPKDLEETVRELVKQWRKSRGAEAQAEELIKALRACDNNLTADKLELKLRAAGY